MCSLSALEPSTYKMLVLDHFERLVSAANTDYRLRNAFEYAKSNLRRDLSLPRIATITNVSVWHICRLFRHEIGISPVRYVKLLRLRCAADLLTKTSLSVKEVMASVGINDESHFVRDFRKFTGEFPVEYRARIRRQAVMNSIDSQDANIGQ
jgi:transcriptional regulator GlxA family with amidase domain